MMAWPTIICGALLVTIGLIGYLNGTPKEGTTEVSPTALIPAAFGAVLILCGALSFNEKLRKHVMHLAAMVGLFGFVGGFVPVVRKAMKAVEGEPAFDLAAPATRNGLLMALVCAVFVFLCVKSFRDARIARTRREAMPVA